MDQYINAFMTAPLAVILLLFIYLTNKQQNTLIKQMGDINKSIMTIFGEAIKIIKQQERKQEFILKDENNP